MGEVTAGDWVLPYSGFVGDVGKESAGSFAKFCTCCAGRHRRQRCKWCSTERNEDGKCAELVVLGSKTVVFFGTWAQGLACLQAATYAAVEAKPAVSAVVESVPVSQARCQWWRSCERLLACMILSGFCEKLLAFMNLSGFWCFSVCQDCLVVCREQYKQRCTLQCL